MQVADNSSDLRSRLSTLNFNRSYRRFLVSRMGSTGSRPQALPGHAPDSGQRKPRPSEAVPWPQGDWVHHEVCGGVGQAGK